MLSSHENSLLKLVFNNEWDEFSNFILTESKDPKNKEKLRAALSEKATSGKYCGTNVVLRLVMKEKFDLIDILITKELLTQDMLLATTNLRNKKNVNTIWLMLDFTYTLHEKEESRDASFQKLIANNLITQEMLLHEVKEVKIYDMKTTNTNSLHLLFKNKNIPFISSLFQSHPSPLHGISFRYYNTTNVLLSLWDKKDKELFLFLIHNGAKFPESPRDANAIHELYSTLQMTAEKISLVGFGLPVTIQRKIYHFAEGVSERKNFSSPVDVLLSKSRQKASLDLIEIDVRFCMRHYLAFRKIEMSPRAQAQMEINLRTVLQQHAATIGDMLGFKYSVLRLKLAKALREELKKAAPLAKSRGVLLNEEELNQLFIRVKNKVYPSLSCSSGKSSSSSSLSLFESRSNVRGHVSSCNKLQL